MASGEEQPRQPAEEEEDLRLIERVLREGTPEAFRPIYERYKDRVYNTAYRITGDPGLAQDVTHDVFVLVYERLGQFRRRSRFSSWLYRVAVNRATDVARRRALERRLFAGRLDGPSVGASVSPPGSPTRRAEQNELAEEVVKAVEELSLKLRTVVVLRHFEGLSYQEIAEVIGHSVGTVKSRLSRAHRRLAERLRRLL